MPKSAVLEVSRGGGWKAITVEEAIDRNERHGAARSVASLCEHTKLQRMVGKQLMSSISAKIPSVLSAINARLEAA